jgi:preprotein translocase subunit SecF
MYTSRRTRSFKCNVMKYLLFTTIIFLIGNFIVFFNVINDAVTRVELAGSTIIYELEQDLLNRARTHQWTTTTTTATSKTPSITIQAVTEQQIQPEKIEKKQEENSEVKQAVTQQKQPEKPKPVMRHKVSIIEPQVVGPPKSKASSDDHVIRVDRVSGEHVNDKGCGHTLDRDYRIDPVRVKGFFQGVCTFHYCHKN